MASRRSLLITAAAMAVVVVGALLPATASAADYIVGDDSGWDVGVDYDAWASGKTFKVNDRLVFRPKTAAENVVWVDEKSFDDDDCVRTNTAQVLSTGKPVTATLGQSGKFFFICDAEECCESGVKLAINVQ